MAEVINPPNKKLQKIYGFLKSKNAVKDSYDQFEVAMQDDRKFQKVHDYLKGQKNAKVSDDFTSFKTNIFGEPVKKKDSTLPPHKTEAPVVVSEPPQQGGQIPIQSGPVSGDGLSDSPVGQPPLTPDGTPISGMDRLAEIQNSLADPNATLNNLAGSILQQTPKPPAINLSELSARNFVEDTEAKNNPKDTPLSVATNAAGNFNKAIVSTLASVPKSVGVLAAKLNHATGSDPRPAEELATYKFGQWLEDAALDIGVTATDPKKADDFWQSTLPSAFGSVAGIVLTGGRSLTGASAKLGTAGGLGQATVKALQSPAAVVGGTSMAIPEFEQAKAAGATDDEAFDVFVKNYLVGQTEVLPIASALRRLNKASGGKLTEIVKAGVKGGFEEGTQEAVQTILTNKIAEGSYDPKRDLFQDVIKSGGAGFFVGFFLPGIHAAMSSMTPEQRAETNKVLNEEFKSAKKGESIVPEPLPVNKETETTTRGTTESPSDSPTVAVPDISEPTITQSAEGTAGETVTTQPNEEGRKDEGGQGETLLTPQTEEAADVAPSVSEITSADVINRDYKIIKEKIGEKKAQTYFKKVDALLNPNENNIVEYRTNGVVTKDGDAYTFHALADMDAKKWRIAFTQDVTDQFKSKENAVQVEETNGVPLQTAPGNSEQVAEGVPESEPQFATEETEIQQPTSPISESNEEKVTFIGHDGGERTGKIQSFTDGKYTIEADNGTTWKVTPDKITSELPKPQSKYDKAKAALRESVDKLKSTYGDLYNENLGIVFDPKREAKKLYDFHKALVDTASKAIDLGVANVEEFADSIGRKVDDFLVRAFNDAKAIKEGKKPTVESEDYFKKEQPEEKLSGIKKDLVPNEKIDETDVEKRSVTAMLERGKSLVDEEKINPKAIVDEIANNNPRALQADEVAALVYYKTKLDNSISSAQRKLLKAQASGNYEGELSAKAELASLNKDLDDYHTMSIKTAYEQSLAFRLRAMLLDSEYNLQSQINKYKVANDGFIPPDVEAKFRQYDQELKDAKEKIKEFEEEKAAREGKETIENIKSDVKRKPRIYGKTRVAKGVEDLAEALGVTKYAHGISRPKITKALSDIGLGLIEEGIATAENVVEKVREYVKDKFKGKINFDDYATDVEDLLNKSFEEQNTKGKIKVPHKVIRDFVESGVEDIEELTEKVKESIKKDFPNATNREVRDAITKYGKEVSPRKDDIESQIRKMKRVGKLISSIEDAQSKKRPFKAGRTREKMDTQERALRRELKDLVKELPISEFEEGRKLDIFKKRVREKIRELEERITNKDFKPKPKSELNRDQEAIALEAEKLRIQEKFDLEHEKLNLQNRSKSQKFWDGLLDVIGLTKTLRTVLDMSAPFRQGIVFTATRPVQSIGAFKEMFRQAFSQENADKWISHIKASPEYALMKASGLYISDPNAKMLAREEQFMSNLAQKIPIYKYLVKASERSYTAFLNKQRVDAFLSTANKFADLGIDPKTDPETYKAWADYVNNATGRGSMGDFEQSAQKLSLLFFSPRLIAARFNLLFNVEKYISMPKAARKEALKSTLTFISIGAAALTLAALGGADVEDDPRSSDFGKIKIGTTRIDVWGGFVQWAVLVSRLFSGERKSTSTGNIETLGEKYGSDTRYDVLNNFFKGKFAPAPALVVKYAESKKNKEGERVTQYGEPMGHKEILGIDVAKDFVEYTELFDLAVPLYLADIDELAKEQGIPTTVGLGAASFFGVGIQNYGSDKKEKSTKGGIRIVNPKKE